MALTREKIDALRIGYGGEGCYPLAADTGGTSGGAREVNG